MTRHTEGDAAMNPTSTAANLVATIRGSIKLRDGYYLSEELVDLYLVGVLRGVAVGLVDADGPNGRDEETRRKLLEDLTQTSADLLEHLHRLRPAPAPRVSSAPLQRSAPIPSQGPIPSPTRPTSHAAVPNQGAGQPAMSVSTRSSPRSWVGPG
jgi:hypothetical protein